MSRGSIRRRGKTSWELKFDLPSAGGRRQSVFVTVRGKRADAERELTNLLGKADGGALPQRSKITVAQHLRGWLGSEADKDEPSPAVPEGLTPKTAERYRELAEGQIIPHLGSIVLQRLRPVHVKEWHSALLKKGSRKDGPLSARTVGHAHRLLHTALRRAVETETITRNVAADISPPRIVKREIEILSSEQIADTLERFEGHPLYSIVVFALATGMRRGEIVGLRLDDLDIDAGFVNVRCAIEQTKAGLRVKEPKTVHGRRTLSLPPSALAVLREHRRKLLETRLALGLGKPIEETVVFGNPDSSLMPPNQLSWLWRSACKALGARQVSFHSLRHTHVSALISAGLDVVTISRRIGHGDPTTTLNTYGHLFKKDDTAAVNAIEAALRTSGEQ